jgi:hypothetical protein
MMTSDPGSERSRISCSKLGTARSYFITEHVRACASASLLLNRTSESHPRRESTWQLSANSTRDGRTLPHHAEGKEIATCRAGYLGFHDLESTVMAGPSSLEQLDVAGVTTGRAHVHTCRRAGGDCIRPTRGRKAAEEPSQPRASDLNFSAVGTTL